MNAWTVLAKIVELFASLGAGAAPMAAAMSPKFRACFRSNRSQHKPQKPVLYVT